MIDGPDDITADWLTTALRAVDARRARARRHRRADRHRPDRRELPSPPRRRRPAADDPGGEDRRGRPCAARARRRRATAARSASTPSSATGCRSARPRCWHAEISDDNCSFVLLLDDLAPARPGVQADGCTSNRRPTRCATSRVCTHRCGTTTPLRPRRLPVVDDGRADRVPGLDHPERGRGVLRALRVRARRRRRDAPGIRRAHGPVGRGRHRCAHAGARRLPARQPDVPRATATASPPSTGRRSRSRHRDAIWAYFLATSLHVDDRRAHQDTLVAAYADEVRRLGVADCTVEQCYHEYRLGVLQAPMITMIGAAYATAGRSASADAMFLAMATRAVRSHPRPRHVRPGRIDVTRRVSCPGSARTRRRVR